MFGWEKGNRRIVTRLYKLAKSYAARVSLACSMRFLRRLFPNGAQEPLTCESKAETNSATSASWVRPRFGWGLSSRSTVHRNPDHAAFQMVYQKSWPNIYLPAKTNRYRLVSNPPGPSKSETEENAPARLFCPYHLWSPPLTPPHTTAPLIQS